jgi:hypothetical protein
VVSYHTFGFQPPADTLPDGFDVPVGISRADNEVISERTEISYVQQHDILCLLLRRNLGC